jgi:hypothetical protein
MSCQAKKDGFISRLQIKGFINKEWLVETEADCVLIDD